MNKLNEALVKLTHAVISDAKGTQVETAKYLNNGLVFIDKNGLVKTISTDAGNAVVTYLNRDFTAWNRHFHQSWEKVADAPIEQLVFEQLMHYFSTYGLEALGFAAMPVLPCETVIADENMRPTDLKAFTVIRVVSEKEAIELLNDYVRSVKKPSTDNMRLVIDVIDSLTVGVDEIPSFEVKCAYCKAKHIAPVNGQDFLRYVVYITTNSTLLIKNKKEIETIKSTLTYSWNKAIADEVADLFAKADLVECSKVFLRNKALFLAFKADKRNAPIINKIRRLAVDNHQPLSELTVANIMGLLGQNKKDDVLKVIKKTSNRNLIKLINAANNDETEDRIYNIRNGKVYVNNKAVDKTKTKWLYKECLKQLSLNLAGKLADKTFYIPTGVDYKAPISEKQMIGNIPYGSTITADTDDDALCVSVAWDNYDGMRTDIDFHLSSATRQFGWNSSYRSGEDILFSGDMTDATNGATETFRVKASDEIFLATVSLFNGHNKCPFKVFLSGADNFRDRNKGLVDINKALVMPVGLAFNGTRSMSIGYMVDKTFTFYGGNLGTNIVPKADLYKNALNAITNRCTAMMSLADVITLAGGTIVAEVPEATDDKVINLAPENITEQMIFSIVDGE